LNVTKHDKRQLAFAAALTAMLLVALGAVGGVSYAAASITHAAKAAAKVVSPSKQHGVVVVKGLTSGSDQYKPGYGFGDKNHNHTGPPGLTGANGAKAPPAQARANGRTERVSTTIQVDEQAALYLSVLDPSGNRLVLNQNGSTVGSKVNGRQVKTIHFVMLVPRSIPIQLLIPKNLLQSGKTYRIHVIAVDHEGNKTTTDIPFVAA